MNVLNDSSETFKKLPPWAKGAVTALHGVALTQGKTGTSRPPKPGKLPQSPLFPWSVYRTSESKRLEHKRAKFSATSKLRQTG